MVTIAQGATIYLDTNALIYLTEAVPQFKARLDRVLRGTQTARAGLATSELAITEVLVGPLRARNQLLIAAYDEMFDAFVEAIPVERSMLIRAAQLRASSPQLRSPDAIHLATAEQLGAQAIVTGDAALAVSPPMERYLLTKGP